MKNFKKILATVGMLGVAVPATLSVVACGQTTTYGINDVDTLSKFINEQAKTVLAEEIDSNWDYGQLFGIKANDEATQLWENILYNPLRAELKALTVKDKDDKDVPKYDEKQIEEQIQNIRKYVQDGLSLVFINNVKDKEDQEVKVTFSRKDAEFEKDKYLTLETMILGAANMQAKTENKDAEDILDLDQLKSVYPHASLGFTFKNKGNVKLKDKASEAFWTFNFITEEVEG